MAFKIDSAGATAQNTFTEGNPAQGIAATKVSDDWLNMVQGEIVEVVENLAGLTLDKQDSSQLGKAILELIKEGGAQIKTSLANNQASGTGLGSDFTFDKTKVQAAEIKFSIERKTDSQNVQEIGRAVLAYDTADDSWRISGDTFLDASGVTFDVDASTGELQYGTDDLTGANYDGQLRAVITKFNL